MKKPSVKRFTQVLSQTGGSISNTARAFGVSRTALYEWVKDDKDFADAVQDARGKLLDECLTISRIVALGIPQHDAAGKVIGWAERPDPSMLRYLISTLGRNEGFSENVNVKADVQLKGSIPIHKWIEDNKE